MDFTTWLTSGWDDAWAQWQHPITSIEDSFASFAGLPITPIPGSSFTDAAGSSADTSSSATSTNWTEIGVFAVIILILILLVLGKLEAL